MDQMIDEQQSKEVMEDNTGTAQQCRFCKSEASILLCQHVICDNCLANHILNHFPSQFSTQLKIKCPVVDCPHILDPQALINPLILVISRLWYNKPSKPSVCTRCMQDNQCVCGDCYLSQMESINKTNHYVTKYPINVLLTSYPDTQMSYKLQEQIEKLDLNCPVCFQVMNDPLIICAIGHETCTQCYNTIRSMNDVNQLCPLCKNQLLDPAPKAIRASVDLENMEFVCPADCWDKQTMNYKQLVTDHIPQCHENEVYCTECLNNIGEGYFKQHLCRSMRCPIPFCNKRLKEHQNPIMDHIINTMNKGLLMRDVYQWVNFLEMHYNHGCFDKCSVCSQITNWTITRNNPSAFCLNCGYVSFPVLC